MLKLFRRHANYFNGQNLKIRPEEDKTEEYDDYTEDYQDY